MVFWASNVPMNTKMTNHQGSTETKSGKSEARGWSFGVIFWGAGNPSMLWNFPTLSCGIKPCIKESCQGKHVLTTIWRYVGHSQVHSLEILRGSYGGPRYTNPEFATNLHKVCPLGFTRMISQRNKVELLTAPIWNNWWLWAHLVGTKNNCCFGLLLWKRKPRNLCWRHQSMHLISSRRVVEVGMSSAPELWNWFKKNNNSKSLHHNESRWLATPKRWRFVRGYDKPRRMGVASHRSFLRWYIYILRNP